MTLIEIVEKLRLVEQNLPAETSQGIFDMLSYYVDEEYARIERQKENDEAFSYTLFEFNNKFFDTEEELEIYLEALRQFGRENNLVLPDSMDFKTAREAGIDTMSILKNENIYGSHNSLFAKKYVYKSIYEGEKDVVSISLRHHPDSYYAIDNTTKHNSSGLPRCYGWINNRGKHGWYNISGTIGNKIWNGPRNKDILNFFQALNERNITLPKGEKLELVKKGTNIA